jgi:hypothetical protein
MTLRVGEQSAEEKVVEAKEATTAAAKRYDDAKFALYEFRKMAHPEMTREQIDAQHKILKQARITAWRQFEEANLLYNWARKAHYAMYRSRDEKPPEKYRKFKHEW